MSLLASRFAWAILLVASLSLAACSVALDFSSATPGPASDAALDPRARLGKLLFEDVSLSDPPGVACASCHDPSRAYTGNAGSPVEAVSRGSRDGVLGRRNAPTAMYASFIPPFRVEPVLQEDGTAEFVPMGGLFWDGRADSLAAQAKGPLLNPREMNNPDRAAVVSKVRASSYAPLFRSVYGEASLDDVDAAFDRVADAIAAFESTPRFAPFSSKFDDVLRGTDRFTELEAEGFLLFKDPKKGNCLACHAGDPSSSRPSDWLFTDFTYDNLGLPRHRAIPDNDAPDHFDLGLCDNASFVNARPFDIRAEPLCGAFRVPTLRNVARTAPYGHNGRFATLRDVVRFYVTRDTNPELWYPATTTGEIEAFDDLPARFRGNPNRDEVPYDRKRGQAPRLDEREIDAVVAFLETLTDR